MCIHAYIHAFMYARPKRRHRPCLSIMCSSTQLKVLHGRCLGRHALPTIGFYDKNGLVFSHEYVSAV